MFEERVVNMKQELGNDPQQQKLSNFLAEFPIQHFCTKPNGGLWCFWSQMKPSQTNSSFDAPRFVPNRRIIHEKLKLALARFSIYYFRGLVQFWVPVTRDGRRLLTTIHQPFGVSHLDITVAQHRICCENYLYDVDMSSTEAQQVEDNTQIIKGPPATAFLNLLPQLVCDTMHYSPKKHLYPPLASALEHGLNGYLVLPIFDHPTKFCVGILEVFMPKHICPTKHYFSGVFAAIEKAGLITFNAPECRPYKSIFGLQRAYKEIEMAWETVCISHKLCLAQAWIRYEYENYVTFSSFTKHDSNDSVFKQNKQVLALKLLHYYNDGLELEPSVDWRRFASECNIGPLKIGEGLVGKALQDHEPYFCKDISMVDKNKPSLSHTAGLKGSCFAICLRSTYTQNLDYVFEFFWSNSQDVKMLLESILLVQKTRLPCFRIVNGEEIGTELCVKEITCSSNADECIMENIVIFEQANKESNMKDKTSPISPPGEVIEQQFERTTIEPAENLNDMPSLRVVTGEEIGNELCAETVPHSSKASECIVEDIVIPQQANKISSRKYKTSHISLHREIIEQQFGRTMNEAAKNLNVCLSTLKRKCKDAGINEWRGPKSGKRKESDSYSNQQGMIRHSIRAAEEPLVVSGESVLDEKTVIVKAKFEDDLIEFCLPVSTATLQAVKEEIHKRFSLSCETYKLKYYKDKDLISILSDDDMSYCIKNPISLNPTTIRLNVVAKSQPVEVQECTK